MIDHSLVTGFTMFIRRSFDMTCFGISTYHRHEPPLHPRLSWYIWFFFFFQDWAFAILFLRIELLDSSTQSDLSRRGLHPGAMITVSLITIVASSFVLLARFFLLRPKMHEIGYAYETAEAINKQDVAREALWWDKRLGALTAFGEDFPQALLALMVAISTRNVSWTLSLSLVTSVGASAYVCYGAIMKRLWSSDNAVLIALFDATIGSKWRINANWNSHLSLEQWRGVECDTGGNVIKLDLRDNGLSGARACH